MLERIFGYRLKTFSLRFHRVVTPVALNSSGSSQCCRRWKTLEIHLLKTQHYIYIAHCSQDNMNRLVYSSAFLLILLVVSCNIVESQSYPTWFQQLLSPYEQSYYPTYPNRQRGARAGGKERYKKVCSVVSGDNYAFPGSIPFPSAPFCPY
ncbi:uncharacterized protein LOC142330349 [Lycorma delicatula]|uniref:uncharacterized protein LOC142330349 n=1 Tax=Lycorma delicatula TaxID=130591 RepID=UPI003F51209A